MRKIVLLLIFITTAIASWADEKITFTASAPEVVVSGDQFRLTFSINSQKIKDFRAPNIKGLEVLMGPSRSTQSSTQIINGNVTSTKSTTFTYILMAEKEGTYSIPGATIVADGNNYTSNSVSVKVLPPDQSTGTASNNGRTSRNQANNGKISEKELFITATASKTQRCSIGAVWRAGSRQKRRPRSCCGTGSPRNRWSRWMTRSSRATGLPAEAPICWPYAGCCIF